MKKQLFYLVALFFFLCQTSFSQKAPVKYGRVSLEDMQMSVYEPDTSAAAVVLCDYGYFNSVDYTFTRTIRYKILKKEGLSFANGIYPGRDKANVRGVVYNLVGGEVVETKLRNESVFRERVTEDYYRMRISMPNVQVGSVFDIEYSHFLLPDSWYFQRTIPVVWSELVVQPTPQIRWSKVAFGYIPFFIAESNRWVVKDVPAFREEPFMNSIENYISKFEFSLQDINIPGYYKAYSTDWQAIARHLNRSPYFGVLLSGGSFLNDDVKELAAQYTVPLDRMRAAYERAKQVRWSEDNGLYPAHNTLSQAFKEKLGNAADVNLMLVQMLRKLDIEAHPVVLSTRANGFLSPAWASLEKLNYVIVRATIDGTSYLLDATEEKLPMGLLPQRSLNWRGYMIQDENAIQVDLITNKKIRETTAYSLDLQDDLTLKGKVVCMKMDYSAYNFRKRFEGFNDQDEFLKDREENYPGLTIGKAVILNIDSIYKPIQEEYEVSLRNRVEVIGEEYYINPMFDFQITDNPFKADVRNYPVSFPYPIDKVFSSTIKIPDGYVVSALPKALSLKMPDNSGGLFYSVTEVDHSVVVTFRYFFNKEMYLMEEYPYLREFYNQLIKKHSEPLIIKKI